MKITVKGWFAAQRIHIPDYSISSAVSEMAEKIAVLNNESQDLRNKITKLTSNLKFSQGQIVELGELIVSLQEERSTLQLKLKRRGKKS